VTRIVTILGLFVLLGAPTRAHAQDWRASVLARAPAEMGAELGFGGGALAQAATPADTAVTPGALPPASRIVGKEVRKQPPLIYPIVAGLAAGFAGAYGGVLIGDSQDQGWEEIPVGAIFGYLVGETVSLPIGVHLGNARHGSFLGDLGVSVLGQLAAIGASAIGNGGGYVVGLAGQVAITVLNERRTGERHLRKEAAAD
jgi:hypothetical protein